MVLGKPSSNETSPSIKQAISFSQQGFLNLKGYTDKDQAKLQDGTNLQNSDKLSEEEFFEKVNALSYSISNSISDNAII